MEVRKAKLPDIDELVELNREVHQIHLQEKPEEFKEFSTEAIRSSFSRALSKESAEVFVCIDQEQIVGYVLLVFMTPPENPRRRSRTVLYVDQIDVKEGYRRRGAGKLLLDAAKEYAVERRLDHIVLDVWSFNSRAVSFFRSQGFSTWIERMAFSLK